MTAPSTAPNAHADTQLLARLRLVAAVACALLVGLALTAVVSAEPLRAYLVLLTGALPEIRWDAAQGWQVLRLVRFGAVLEDSITLSLLGLAVAIPFRARQFSLGAEGQLFLGALAATASSLALGAAPWFVVLPIAFLSAMVTGFAWGLLPGLLKARYQASEIVSTLMLNLIAIQFYRLVVSGPLLDPTAGFLATPLLNSAATLQAILPRTNVSVMLLVVPLVAGAAWLLIMRTAVGYEIRTVGLAPAFARQVGMPVTRAVVLSMALGGVFAGLAGLHISHALLKRLPVDLTPGLGFEGLVVALLARNDPKAIPMAAFFYAYLRTGAQAMERSTDVSREMVLVIQAFIILFVVSERLLPAGLPAALRRCWARLWTRGEVAAKPAGEGRA